MKALLKTTDKKLADICYANAQKEFGVLYVYRFQYKAKDGNFYYEILLKEVQ